MSESNDQAFIKVNQELLRCRNDLQGLRKARNLASYLHMSARGTLKEVRPDTLHSPEYQGLSRALNLMSDLDVMDREIRKVEARVGQLEQLSEAYVRGKDIVQTRLSMD